MAQVDITSPVDHCRWVMRERADGTRGPRKVWDCQKVTCKYSINFRKLRPKWCGIGAEKDGTEKKEGK